MKLHPHFISYMSIKSLFIKDINIRPTKYESIERMFYDIDFSDGSSKALHQTVSKLKYFFEANKIKNWPTGWENVFIVKYLMGFYIQVFRRFKQIIIKTFYYEKADLIW